MIENLNLLKEKFSGSISINENLSKYNWFNLGGPAEMLFKPKNIEQLKEFLKQSHLHLVEYQQR